MSTLLALPRATFLIYRLHIGMILGSRRSLAAIGLAVVPPLLAFLASNFAPDNRGATMIYLIVGTFVLIQFVVPMLSVAMGVGVVADEAESRTITFPFTRPIPRASLFLGRWLAAVTAILTLIAASGVLSALAVRVGDRGAPPSNEVIEKLVFAAMVGGVVYSLGSAVIGVLAKRGLIFALGYVFAVEALLANVPGSSQKLTVQYHLRSMFVDQEGKLWKSLEEVFPISLLDPDVAFTKMMIASAVLLVFGCIAVTRKQFVLAS
ncbi:ABC-2 family transporter protein [Planctomycetes bacterium Poly30]|uniref:ABC-2 family transporter protein n=1 Tax=Saltatorellus ferox TaxID=2528018 RepID=A0A518ETX3_9BACT|nr:ABC-2 family transporter protein [Planctomycetes bacterium Poly30]